MSARIPVTSHDKSMNMITKLASIQIRSQKRVGCLIRAGIGKWRAAGLVVHASTAQSTAHRAKAHAVATGNTQLRQCTAQKPADGFAAKNSHKRNSGVFDNFKVVNNRGNITKNPRDRTGRFSSFQKPSKSSNFSSFFCVRHRRKASIP